jgi:hypothetical protein
MTHKRLAINMMEVFSMRSCTITDPTSLLRPCRRVLFLRWCVLRERLTRKSTPISALVRCPVLYVRDICWCFSSAFGLALVSDVWCYFKIWITSNEKWSYHMTMPLRFVIAFQSLRSILQWRGMSPCGNGFDVMSPRGLPVCLFAAEKRLHRPYIACLGLPTTSKLRSWALNIRCRFAFQSHNRKDIRNVFIMNKPVEESRYPEWWIKDKSIW